MKTNQWYRGMIAAAALATTVALAALLGTQAGAFAQANDPGAAPAQPGAPGTPPGPPPEVAPEPPGPPPAPREAEAGRDDMPPPPMRGGHEGMRPRERGWDRQGPPDGDFDRPYGRGPEGRRGEYGEGPGPRGRGEFGEGPRGRGGEFGDRQGPPPGPRFRDGGPGRFEDGDRPCPPEFRGEGRGEFRGEGPRMRHEMRRDDFEPPRPPDPEALFDAMDKNHDGALTKDEFRTFHDQHRPPRPPMNDSQDDRPAPPQRPFPQDDRP